MRACRPALCAVDAGGRHVARPPAGLPLAQPREADAVVAPVEQGQVAPAAGGVGADGGLPADAVAGE